MKKAKKVTTIMKEFQAGEMRLESPGSAGLVYHETSTGFVALKGKRKIVEVLDYDKPAERLRFFEPVSAALLEDITELLEEGPFDRSLPITV
jgi:hypothetical protein